MAWCALQKQGQRTNVGQEMAPDMRQTYSSVIHNHNKSHFSFWPRPGLRRRDHLRKLENLLGLKETFQSLHEVV